MTRTRQAWATVIESGDYRISDLSTLMNDWEGAEAEADLKAEEVEQGFDAERGEWADEKFELEQEVSNTPVWGNCRRGCPPAYLDREGFCSPACRVGAPRGEFVTLSRELMVSDGDKATQ